MTASGSRPLDKINKGNVKGLKIAYAVPLGNAGVKQFIEATPLAEDGFLYITDSGACSTRSTAPPAASAGSFGTWTRSRSGKSPTAAPPSGAIS